MKKEQLLHTFEKLKQKHRSAKYKCSYSSCQNLSIKSHVLQKNGILKNISSQNHLYQFADNSTFIQSEKGKFGLKKIGINDVYTFPGFCKTHDTELFSKIETKEIDFNNRISQALFAYRAICQEIYRKISAAEVAKDIIMSPIFDESYKFIFSHYYKGIIHGINNLNFFKKELEKEISGNITKLNFDFFEFEKLEVCISAPLNIYDKENKLTYYFDDNLNIINEIYVTSIINIFPYKDKSFFLIATHEDYECSWTMNIFDKFKSESVKGQLKIISDFLSSRFEFWCISPNLKQSLSHQKIINLCKVWENEIHNFNKEINIEFNLFEK